MPRFLLLSSPILLIAAPALQSCSSEPAVAVAPSGSSEDIVILEDGATIAARKGTTDRAMADWLADAGSDGTSFALGAKTFVAGSTQLSRDGLGDAATLATLLDATPDARLALIGHSDTAGDPLLGQKRAEMLAEFLEGRGIASDRLAVRSGDKSAGSAQLILIAQRGSWNQPIPATAR